MKTSLYKHCVAVGKEDVIAQWHPTRNGDLTPKDLAPGSHTKVWWRCSQGHEWQAAVYARASKKRTSDCPVCAGKVVLPGFNDLASRFPDIVAQWHPTRNGDLTPDRVTPKSNRKVWWLCEKGHVYQAAVFSRVRRDSNDGCPYCAGRKVLAGFNDLASRHPVVANQWHPELNGDLTPEMVAPSSHKRVWWQCTEGHVWQARVDSRTGARKCGCPVCARHVRKTDNVL